jgi:hypothetical protein
VVVAPRRHRPIAVQLPRHAPLRVVRHARGDARLAPLDDVAAQVVPVQRLLAVRADLPDAPARLVPDIGCPSSAAASARLNPKGGPSQQAASACPSE